MINNPSSAKNPLEPVAERVSTLISVIHGVIERKGQGTFSLTKKGQGLQDALRVMESSCPEMTDEQRVQFVKNWLDQNP